MASDNGQSFLTSLAQDIFDEWLTHQPEIHQETLHPCYLAEQPHLVTRKGLARDYPAAYCSLTAIASKYGVKVFEDRRQKIQPINNDKRKRIALMVGLVIGMATRQLAYADELDLALKKGLETVPSTAITNTSHLSDTSQLHLSHGLSARIGKDGKIRLGQKQASDIPQAKSARHQHSTLIECLHRNPAPGVECLPNASAQTVKRIKTILLSKLGARINSATKAQIDQIARYYGRYPRVIALLEDLAQRPWSLHIAKRTWQARAIIQSGQVDRVEVYFDPSTAAQMLFIRDCASLPNCTVSAADGLLHELLHAQLMLQDPRAYAEANLHALYPMEHEHEVIGLENQIYASMSRVDNIPRPLRNQHQARLLFSQCPVCMPE